MNFLVIDGNSILNRAFYGIKVLTTKDGRFTNAIYGFMNIFLRLKDECQPQAVAVAFDVKQPTFRHEMYGGYKATRKGMPDELAQQMPVLKELLEAMGVPIVEKPGYEADDILGTLARHSGSAACTIATGDRFIGDSETKRKISEMFGGIACEMEGAAIGQVCYVNRVPFCVLRAISDSADGSSHMDYPTFVGMAAEQSVKLLRTFLKN